MNGNEDSMESTHISTTTTTGSTVGNKAKTNIPRASRASAHLLGLYFARQVPKSVLTRHERPTLNLAAGPGHILRTSNLGPASLDISTLVSGQVADTRSLDFVRQALGKSLLMIK